MASTDDPVETCDGLTVTDVAVIPGDRLPDTDGTQPGGDPDVELATGLTLKVLPAIEADSYFDAVDARGLNFHPVRQFGQTYAFVRRHAPRDPLFAWDPDLLIRHAFQLSRLIRDNAHCSEYAVRVIEDARRQIAPASGETFLAYHAGTPERKWLSQQEARDLGSLLRRFLGVRDRLPLRVRRGLWLAEYAVRDESPLVAIVWTVASIEALFNTDPKRLRKQFRERTVVVSAELGVPQVTEEIANRMYSARSEFVHGALAGAQDEDQLKRELYQVQSVVRAALRRAIEVDAFAARFHDDDSVRESWPVEL